MKQYHDLIHHILDKGVAKNDRTGTGTLSVFGHQMRFTLSDGFPLLTTKRLRLKSIVGELLWFLSGSTNNNDLKKHGITIWDDWSPEDGDLGPIYGRQWRSWSKYKKYAEAPGYYRESIDQISDVIKTLKTDPDSRRMVVSAWNPAEIPQMALAPCHCLFQFNTRPLTLGQRLEVLHSRHECIEIEDVVPGIRDFSVYDGEKALHAALDKDGIPSRYLDCQLYQRSCDIFLGVPFNIASYALLVHLISREVGMVPGDFVWSGGDVHLYSNHVDQAREQLSREERSLPTLKIRDRAPGLFQIQIEDISAEGYDPHPAISAPVAV